MCGVFINIRYPGGPHLERVGINWKEGAATENHGADVKYMGSGVYVFFNVFKLKYLNSPVMWETFAVASLIFINTHVLDDIK